jgi:hypothetical protein
MAWAPTTPAVITFILGLFRSGDLGGADVLDGPEVTGSGALEVVIVGWYGQASDTLAADGTVVMEGLAGSPDRESYEVRCAALVLNAAGDLALARARAYELATACGALVAANRTLGGLVLRAGVTTQALRQDQPTGGARATVEFGVAVDAYTTT